MLARSEHIENAGIKPEYCYAAGFASIGLSFVSCPASRSKEGHHTAQPDRWGIFVGHWAPTFFALGSPLKLQRLR